MRVSILSAVHNEGAHVEEMIRSVRAQTHLHWELLFVSDGSTDGTMARLESAAGRDKRIKIIGDGSKVGKVRAFNAAFAEATGEVIVLLAGDDRLPRDSIERRHDTIASMQASGARRPVAFFKLRTFSEDIGFDGLVLPRGSATAAHSGGTWTASRSVAEVVFPVNDNLISEDLWVCHASEGLADCVVDVPAVALEYRIHEGNSNPRLKSFTEQSAAFAARHVAFRLLLATERLELSVSKRLELGLLARAEELRSAGSCFRLLGLRGLPLTTRLSFISQSSALFAFVRRRFYSLLSGWQGR